MTNLKSKQVGLLGIPWDQGASFLQGAAQGPARIREALHNGASNYWSEQIKNPFQDSNFLDLGDLDFENYFDIEQQVIPMLSQGIRLLTLGGDHSITYPLIRAYHQFFQKIEILQIDAHGDLYDEFEGNPYSHACPFARIMEENLASHLTQVGVRTLNPHQKAQATRFSVETINIIEFERGRRPALQNPIYLSLDLDGLDPAFAPGVSHHEPGGLTSREVLRIIQNITVPVIGADIVELNPNRDLSNMTAALAAKFVKEIAVKMLEEYP